jgi:hypothetical protein
MNVTTSHAYSATCIIGGVGYGGGMWKPTHILQEAIHAIEVQDCDEHVQSFDGEDEQRSDGSVKVCG